MLLLDKFGWGRVPAEVQGATLLVSATPLPASAAGFLRRLQQAEGQLTLAVPAGADLTGTPVPLPVGTGPRIRWLRRAAPRRLLLLGEVPDGADLARAVSESWWINAPAHAVDAKGTRMLVSDPALADAHSQATLTGDPLLSLAAPHPAPGDSPLCERFGEQRRTGRWIVYFAATGEGEESIAYGSFFKLARRKMGFLVVAPGDPARYEPVYREALKYRLPTNRHNRLSTSRVPLQTRVYYIENPQTLADMYACADVVVVGGTLAPGAGIEPDVLAPLLAEKPILVGPAFGSDPIAAAAVRDGAILLAQDEDELVDLAYPLLNEPERATALIERARRWLDAQYGATERVLKLLAKPGPGAVSRT